MKRLFLLLCAVLAGVATVFPAAADEWVDWAPKKGVWRFESVKVDPDKIDEYVTFLKKAGEIQASEELKKLGVIDNYVVLVKLNPFSSQANVILGQHFTTYAALEPEVVSGPAMRKKLAAAVAASGLLKDPKDKEKVARLLADLRNRKSYAEDELWYEVDFTAPVSAK